MFWSGRLFRRKGGAAIPVPPPEGHYPDLTNEPYAGMLLLANCGRCGTRMFKMATGQWKPIVLRAECSDFRGPGHAQSCRSGLRCVWIV